MRDVTAVVKYFVVENLRQNDHFVRKEILVELQNLRNLRQGGLVCFE